ncbi:uncharacterized protein LOC121964051 [Plectropomus leopardus]|uniref:uncharacterized protein LOC121964051 n=1 Tax=Plectropomus leopardus TaxID=160734 RepID=UPI001C4A8C9F|nr:uncharacterized protein LOC121964051 [Plectropomus leopardus]
MTVTTLPPTTAAPTTVPPPVVVLQSVLEVTFQDELTDSSSSQFRDLEAQVVAVYDVIYRTQFGALFIRSFVIAFRPAAARERAVNTEAEVGVQFSETASSEEIPTSETVANTLVEAVTNPSNNFSLTIDPTSVQVVGK